MRQRGELDKLRQGLRHKFNPLTKVVAHLKAANSYEYKLYF